MKNTRMQIKPTLNQEECVLPGITFILNIISENGSKNKIKDINSTKTSFFFKKKKMTLRPHVQINVGMCK